jgi:hypothetical protein
MNATTALTTALFAAMSAVASTTAAGAFEFESGFFQTVFFIFSVQFVYLR